MTVTVKPLIPAKQVEAAQTTQYTAEEVEAIIDKFTVTNTSGGNVTFSCNLVSAGGTAGVENLIIDSKTITPQETYTCPELVGQVLGTGGFISTSASVATSLTMRASGREVT